MKAFLVVSLVCYFGAASAGLPSPAVKLGTTADECRHEAYLGALNCTQSGFNNGLAELQCLSAVVLKYMNCIEESEPTLLGASPLGGNLTDVQKGVFDKFKCIFNNILETIQCIVNDHKSFKVSWPVIIKCLVINLPGMLGCFPQDP